MAKDPAFLFYSQDFLVGVMTMSFEDRGKYITILSLMHQQGRMTEETIRLLVGSISDTLRLKFSQDEKGLLFNSRLEEETEKRQKFTESRRINGLSGGRPKGKKPNGKPKKNLVVKHMDNHMEDEIVNVNESIFKGSIWDNETMNAEWSRWIEYKRVEFKDKYKSKETEKQAGRNLWDLSKGNQDTAIKIINKSIANHYKGLFELKENGKIEQPTTRLGEGSHDGKQYKL